MIDQETKDLLVVSGVTLIASILIAGGVNELCMFNKNWECTSYSTVINKPTKFVRLTLTTGDCFVKNKSGWIPLDRIREVVD